MKSLADGAVVALCALLALLVACGGGDAGGTTGPTGSVSSLTLTLSGLSVLDPALDGSYAAWIVDGSGGVHAGGTFVGATSVALHLSEPIDDAAAVLITVQPPGDDGVRPSAQQLLRGTIQGGRAALSLAGVVTQGDLPLIVHPGQFTIFTPSNNGAEGYPSEENAGIWLFNMAPLETPQQDMWVRLTQLQRGWVYGDWVVRDFDQPSAVWFSMGKFVPDQTGAVNGYDDDGWGPFSGVLDFASEDSEEFPGSDFVSNPLNLPIPGNLALPLNLLETTTGGASRWTHVITIEPAWKRGEPMATERPFIIRPYYDPVGTAGPGLPRPITLHQNWVPQGTAQLR
jgi:hypothetical protein